MNTGIDTAGMLRALSQALDGPTHVLLLVGAALCVFELGVFAHERWFDHGRADPAKLVALGRARVDRADVLARVGPMLGLMGTLIPLGPGLSALGQGDLASLAAAVTVAFDTTVLGLSIGIVGFCLARARRHHYDRRLDALDEAALTSAPSMTQASSATPLPSQSLRDGTEATS